MSGFMYLFKSMAFLIAIILLANYLLRKLNHFTNKHQKNIKIIEKVSVSKDSALTIVCICDSYYLMSFTAQGNEIIKELSDGEANEIRKNQQREMEQQVTQTITFKNRQSQVVNYWQKIIRKRSKL